MASTTIDIHDIADTYVDQAVPSTNYGTLNRMYVDSQCGHPYKRTYIRFPLSTIPAGSLITSANLMLDGWYSSQTHYLYVRNVIDRTWTETGLTWNNQPAFESYPNLSFYGSSWPNSWNSYNITSYIVDQFSKGVNADFMLQGAESGPTCFSPSWYSKEGGTTVQPILRVTYTTDITATSMTATPLSCTAPCTTVVSVTWKNNGTVSYTFIPAIAIDGTIYNGTSVTLAAGATTTQSFNVTNLGAGSHLICPVPN